MHWSSRYVVPSVCLILSQTCVLDASWCRLNGWCVQQGNLGFNRSWIICFFLPYLNFILYTIPYLYDWWVILNINSIQLSAGELGDVINWEILDANGFAWGHQHHSWNTLIWCVVDLTDMIWYANNSNLWRLLWNLNMTFWTFYFKLTMSDPMPTNYIHRCICKCILYMCFCFKQLWNCVLFLPDGVPVQRVVRLKILKLVTFFLMRHFPMPWLILQDRWMSNRS